MLTGTSKRMSYNDNNNDNNNDDNNNNNDNIRPTWIRFQTHMTYFDANRDDFVRRQQQRAPLKSTNLYPFPAPYHFDNANWDDKAGL